MSAGNTVMIFGLGDLGGWVMEFLARREGVSTIIACDKREDWGILKTNGVAVAAGTEGYCKTISFEKCDVFDTDATAELINKYNPDLIYTGMTLMSWTIAHLFPHEVAEDFFKIAGTLIPCHLTLPYKLMQAVKKSGCTAVCLNNSWPDIVNPMLWRSGLGVLVGAGNLDLIVFEMKRRLSVKENVPMREINVYFIAEHVVNVMGTRTGIPYFLRVMIGDKDITSKYDVHSLTDRLMGECPHEWYSWVRHPEVASSAVKNIMAILNDTNEFTHAPGPNGLIGGYPIRIGARGIEIELPEGITMEQAIKINVDDCKYEGIEEIKDDGTLVVTDEAYKIAKKLFGIECREIQVADTADWAKEIVAGHKRLADKYSVKIPVY